MDFKKLVMHDTENKYQDMVNGTTAISFTDTVTVSDYNNYNRKRNSYYRRLDREKSEFNSALTQIRKVRDARIKAENNLKATIKRDRKKFVFCNNILFLSVLVIIAIVYFAMRNGGAAWVKDVLIFEMGFENFFAIFDSYSSNVGFEICVLSMILGGLLYLSLLIFAIVQKVRYDEFGWLIGVLLGGLLLSGLPFMLCWLLIRLLFVPFSYVIYFVLTPYGLLALGGIALLMLMIRCTKFELKRFKFRCVFNMILLIAVVAGGWYIGEIYSNIANEYYEAHNGTTIEKAVEVEVGDSYLANIKEEGGNYYFVFTPTMSGEYTISSTDDREIKVELYSKNGELLGRDGDEDEYGFSLTKSLKANEKYYICVGFIEDYHNGHFLVNIIWGEEN